MGTIATMNVKLAMDSADFERGVANAQSKIESMSAKLKSVGTAMSLGITAPLVGIAGAAIKSAGDFEQSMNVMAQVTGATADQMASLQQAALDLGAVTSFSAGEAADAQLELAKAGLSVNEILAATPGVMDMAAAGGIGLAQSAEIAANAMNAFNLPAAEMGTVANMLAAAANASSVDIGDLAAAMKMSGAVFAANKQPLDDMVTALAMLGNAGLKGSDAGTSLKTMMMSLAAPTDAALENLNAMNVAVYDAAGGMRQFDDILGDLALATAKMSDEQRNVALSTIFGSDAIRAASILTRDYGKSWDSISDALGDGSAASKVAGARMKGMAGAIEYLKGSIDSFLIGAALPYLNMLGDWVRMSADALTAFGALPAPILNAAVAIGAVLAAAGPLMLVVSGLGAVIGFLVSPIGLAIAAVGALVAVFTTDFLGIRTALVNTINSFEELGAIANDVFGAIGALVAGDYQEVSDKLNSLRANFASLVQSVQAIDWGGMWASFQQWVTNWATAVADSVTAIDWAGTVGAAASTFSGLITAVVDALMSIDWGGAVVAAGDMYAAYISAVIGGLTSIDWGSAVKTAGDIYAAYWGAVIGGLTSIDWGGAMAAAGDVFTDLKSRIMVKLNTIDWAGAMAAAGDIFAQLKGRIAIAMQSIDWAGVLTAAGAWLTGFTSGVAAALQTIDWGTALSTAGPFLTGFTTGVVAALQSIDWAGAIATAGDTFTAMRDNTLLSMTAAFEGMDITGAFTGWINSITTTISTTDWSAIGTAVGGALTTALNPENIKTAAAASFALMASGITAALAGIVWIMDSENFAGFATSVKTAISNIDWGEVGASFTKLKEAIKKALGDFAGGLTEGFKTPEWLSNLLAWKWPEMPAFNWPTLPTFRWPSLPTWTWPKLPSFKWPEFPRFEWPSIPTPPWVDSLLSFFGGGIPGLAAGGPVTAGVPYIVGERGEEMFVPNVNGTIIPNHELGAYAGEAMASGGGAAVQIGTVNVLNEIDIRELAYQVAGYMQRRR
jgi:TP901 family phage tail tape measure protein